MKRIVTLMLAMGLVLGAAANSSAVDVKAKGTMTMEYGWVNHVDFAKGETSQDRFVAQQRMRTQADFVASENLAGVLYFEIDNAWGYGNSKTSSGKVGAASGGDLGADGVNIETKRAYIDWSVPNTTLSFRMGIQGIALPAAVAGNSILDDDVAAIVASYKINEDLTASAFWARPYDGSLKGPDHDEIDLFGLVVGVDMDGMSITPYGMYGAVGRDSATPAGMRSLAGIAGEGTISHVGATELTEDTDYNVDKDMSAYWLGLAFNADLFDPLTFALDFAFGSVDGKKSVLTMDDGTTTTTQNLKADYLDRSGWAVNAKLSYKLDDITPGIIGWYASGEDKKVSNGSERMPTISGAFAPTTFGYDGTSGNYVAQTADAIGTTNVGTWAVGLLVEDMKFIEDLTSQFRVIYVTGTNDHKVLADLENKVGISRSNLLPFNFGEVFLTDKDHAWEVNFDHKYQIYENLALIAELGYIHLDLKKSTWNIDSQDYEKDAWKASFLFQYSF